MELSNLRSIMVKVLLLRLSNLLKMNFYSATETGTKSTVIISSNFFSKFFEGKILTNVFFFLPAVQAKNVVVLSVDSENSDPGIGVPGSTSTDTKSPLFVGSAGPKGTRLRGTITPHQYIGCIRNILINDNPIKLPPHRAFGNVTVSACPTI